MSPAEHPRECWAKTELACWPMDWDQRALVNKLARAGFRPLARARAAQDDLSGKQGGTADLTSVPDWAEVFVVKE